MARYRTQSYCCVACEHYEDDVLVTIADGDPYTLDGCPILDCPGCETAASFAPVPSAPTLLKASLPDGTYRGERWQILKEASTVEHKMQGKLQHRREEDMAQLADLGKAMKKHGHKNKEF